MNPVTLDPSKLAATIAKLRLTFRQYGKSLAAIKPTDPEHWRPNIISARDWSMRMAGERLVDEHFEGRRFRGSALERRKAGLSRLELWVPIDLHDRVRKYAANLHKKSN